MNNRLLLSLLLLALVNVTPALAQAPTTPATSGQEWLTAASNVRLRAAASATSEELERLPLGVIVRQTATAPVAAQIAEKQDHWYQVITPSGKTGWVFGALLVRFAATRQATIYRELAATRANASGGSYADFADLVRWLTSLNANRNALGADAATQAELELWRWIAVQRALNEIPADKLEQADYQRFIKAAQPNVTYSDPGGIWLLKAEVLWRLHKQAATLPIAETIAWEAAKIPLPGECEGDLSCSLNYVLETEGRYLQLYPNGKYADTALARILESYQDAKGLYELDKDMGGTQATAKAERRQLIAKLRATYARSTNPKKAQLDTLLAKLAAFYR